MSYIRAFDCFDGNGAVDWPTAAKLLLPSNPDTIVLPKANEYDFTNPAFHAQRMGAHAAGFRWVFPYDFARYDLASGAAECVRFIAAIGADGGLLPNEGAALDIEYVNTATATADLRAYVADWFGTWRRATGLPLVVYSSVDQLDAFHLFDDPTPIDDPNIYLWLAAPGASEPPTSPKGKVVMWQYDWHGYVPGFTGDVDLSYWLGSVDLLRSLTWGNQPDPLAGQRTVGTADLDPSVDVPTILHHVADLLAAPTLDVPTIRADIALARTKFGLVT